MKTTFDPVPRAALLVLTFATVIGFTDNYVRVIAAEVGLWQFHVTRTLMILVMLAALIRPMGLVLRPRRWGGVLGRSALHGTAMMIYFGALGFLPVAVVAAGLFTAPIFVLLISRFVYGHRIGIVRVVAVALGFAGVAMVLGREALEGASLAALMPVVAGAFYAMGNVATREWCAEETTETLTLGFFAGIGAFGLLGLVALTLFPVPVADGAAGFVARGWVWPSASFYGWTFVQAAGSLVGVALLMRAYQIAEASRVAVFEYLALPLAAFWGWLLWQEQLSGQAALGMVLIASAGAMIALRGRQSPEVSPTA
ncbi:DMT family transporter [Pseudorhodobacter sp. E13]|uniref:DMT family transporter n=1 Tax=Pseudorhodobacter sp. E13 TaxID=2487931 RepID=UPI000F8E8486|nr:DMT family transporter [Pseudorhodobacter sp. E13]RUS65059.1 DMT family transporter [Pseudorhodobacter sp. E13]